MGIYTRYISTIKAIDSIKVDVQNTLKDVVGVYVFVNGERKLIFPEPSVLLYTNTTPGEFSFQMPGYFDFAYIEYAGAGAADGAYFTGGITMGAGGKGNILKSVLTGVSSKVIAGTIGRKGGFPTGGTGMSNGTSGQTDNRGGSDGRGGGGGGSTGFQFNSQTFEASGGGGATINAYLGGYYHILGGTGGGQYGGTPGITQNVQLSATDGHDATDPLAIGYNINNGYIKIWGIATPDVVPPDALV